MDGDRPLRRRRPVAPRRAGPTAWLRTLAAELDDGGPGGGPAGRRSSSPRATSSRACWRRAIDPFAAILRAALHPERRPMRWVVVRGRRRPGPRAGDPAERPGLHRARASDSSRRPPAGTASSSSSGDPADRRAARRRRAAARRAARRPHRPPARDRPADPRRGPAPVARRPSGSACQPGDGLGRGRPGPRPLDRAAGRRAGPAARRGRGDRGRAADGRGSERADAAVATAAG